MKAIETVYGGYRFRSRLEAKWAVFFDACGASWEYEPEGFDLDNGLCYLPDFLLHDIGVRGNDKRIDLWVEVKGVMAQRDAIKIETFAGIDKDSRLQYGEPINPINPIIVLGEIPRGDNICDIFSSLYDQEKWDGMVCPFSFILVDGDNYPALLCVGYNGGLMLLGDQYTIDADECATIRAMERARQARFEHGETPGGCGKHDRLRGCLMWRDAE